MDRIIKYIVIIIILASSVMIVLSATHSSALINGLLIGIGALSIVTVLWYLFLPNLLVGIRIKTMNILFVLLIIMAAGFYVASKVASWQASQIEKARLQQNPALIENHQLR